MLAQKYTLLSILMCIFLSTICKGMLNKEVEAAIPECDICYDKQPVTLTLKTCGHKFCARCIGEISGPGSENVLCPLRCGALPVRIDEYEITVHPCQPQFDPEIVQYLFPLICFSDNLQNVKQYVRTFKPNVNELGFWNFSPIHLCQKRRIAKYLFRQGAEASNSFLIHAQNGNIQMLKFLLKKNKINIDNAYGKVNNPLHLSSGNDRLNCLKRLVANGADIDRTNTYGWTSLIISSDFGHLECVKHLVAQGADVNKPTNCGSSPLFISAQKGHLEIVKVLVLNGANVNDTRNKGITPLWKSAQFNHLAIVKFLLDNGAIVDYCDKSGLGGTALCDTTLGGHLEVVKYLVSKGADVNHMRNDGGFPLDFSVQNNYLEITKFLIQHGANINRRLLPGMHHLIFRALKNENLEIVKLLLENGANVNITQNDGITPLQICACKGYLEIAQLLIEKGADVANINQGLFPGMHHPIFSALKNNNLEIAKLLLENGANVNLIQNDGITPLHICARKGYLEIAQLLIEKGADVKQGLFPGMHHPIFRALKKKNLEIVKLLLENGASVNVTKNDGITPLHICARNDYLEIAQLLLEKEADINQVAKDRLDGYTPLMLTTSPEMTYFLLKNGAINNLRRKRENEDTKF